MPTKVTTADPTIAQLLKFADVRYVLSFNPLAGVPPIRIPQPQPDPAPGLRRFG